MTDKFNDIDRSFTGVHVTHKVVYWLCQLFKKMNKKKTDVTDVTVICI